MRSKTIGSFLAVLMLTAASQLPALSKEITVVTARQDEASGSFELVGHDPLNNRGMNSALGVHENYVYVGSRTDAKAENANGAGVLVVDVTDPAAPEVVHEIETPNEANPGETSRELRVWRSQEILLVMNLYSNCGEIHACTPTEAADNYRFYDISGEKAAAPELIATYEPTADPHEFYLWEDPKDPKRALLFQSTPGGGGTQLIVTDISGVREEKFVELAKQGFGAGDPGNDNRLHSLALTPDGKRAHVAHLEAGFLVLDTSAFAKGVDKPQARLLTPPKDAPRWVEDVGPGAHSSVPLFGKPYSLVTDEVYGEALRPLDSGGCPWGWVRMIDVRKPVAPKIVSEYKLPQNDPAFCNTDVPRPFSSYSAHNPTLTKNLALITWHAGGLQAVDISDPTKPSQAAEFLPTPELYVLQEDPVLSMGQDKIVMWSYPVIQDGLIYVTDVRNGLFILKYTGPFEKEISSVEFLEGNSNLGDAVRLAKKS